MKSRRATYLLLAAVVAVWGVVGWKILAPRHPDRVAAPIEKTPGPDSAPPADTLRLDYPDPFLKNTVVKPSTASRSVERNLPPPRVVVKRSPIAVVHTGTVVSGGQALHILTVGDSLLELRPGETVGEITLVRSDPDSLYLSKEGMIYGVKRCE